MAEEAWKEIYAWARGLRVNPPAPSTNKELNVRFGELMGAPRGSWDGIMTQPVGDAEEPQKIGGMNSKGEPIIDEGFQSQNCDDIIAGVRLHEAAHKQFFLAFSLDRIVSELMSSNLLWLRAESEVEAYRAEKEFLKGKAEELEKKCGRTATATTPNGITYTAIRCEASPWGPWKLTVSGPMAGQGTVTVEQGGSGTWSANTVVSGAGVAIQQTGSADYVDGPNPQLRLTTKMATAMGKTAAPGKSIDLAVKFGGEGCGK